MINLLKYETKLWNRGINLIAGVDEAGRGPLAGPLVAAAVVLKKESLEIVKDAISTLIENPRNYDVQLEENLKPYLDINDSKKLTSKKREKLFDFIKKESETFSIIEVTPQEIDNAGIANANQKGFINAVNSLNREVEHILTDHFPITSINKKAQTNITRGDSLSINIAAASILAKVYRDNLMRDYAKKYPNYGFERHKGYGTKKHREVILKFGPCPIHRKSFEPTKSLLKR
jgi:ribonuclease HII